MPPVPPQWFNASYPPKKRAPPPVQLDEPAPNVRFAIMVPVREIQHWTVWTGCIPAQMFDWRVVLVPSAGRPTAVPLWVPALRAGMSQGEGGWWVVAMTPACHLTILFCQRLGHVSRVCTSLRPLSASDYKWHRSTSFRCKARQEAGFSLTHSHLCTYRTLQMSHGKAVQSLSDWCPPPPPTGKG